MRILLHTLIIAAPFLYYADNYACERHEATQDKECRAQSDNHRCHKESQYLISNNQVFFDGVEVKGASSISFTTLKHAYAKDSWNVYYKGKKMAEASPNSFKVLRDGYAKDAWNVYYKGKKVAEASPNSFKVLRDGYAKDSWNTYYFGKKLP